MNLKELATKLIEQAKAKDLFGAMKTLAEILNKTAATGELLFGAAVDEDLAGVEAELSGLKAAMTAHCSCEGKDGSCKGLAAVAADAGAKPEFDPTPLILALVDVVLKIIAERRKNKQ